MESTVDNLKAGFAGESQANRRYLAYAKKADQEGFPQVARLFRAVAAAETVHAMNHFRTLGEIKDTAENLTAAISGENYESETMYPGFISTAEAEGEKKALTSFRWAMEVERVHEQLYRKALDTLGKDGQLIDYYVCPTCGYTCEGSAPDRCPVCGGLGSRFELVK